MLITKLGIQSNIVGTIIDTEDGYILSSKELSNQLHQKTGYSFDTIFLVLDTDMAPISIVCEFDCGDEETHFLIYEVRLSQKEINYLSAQNYL